MYGKAHLFITGILIVVAYYLNLTNKWLVLDNKTLIILAGVALLYSLAPDIDQPNSYISELFTISIVAVIIYSFYNPNYKQYGIIAAVLLGVVRLITHRTLIHSVLAGVILSAPLLYLGPIYFGVGLASFIVHIIIDGDFSIFAEHDWW